VLDGPVLADLLRFVPGLVRVAVTLRVELRRAVVIVEYLAHPLSINMSLPVRIATALVAGEWFKAYMREYVGLQTIRAAAKMGALVPGAQKNEGGRLLPRRRRKRKVLFGNDIGSLSDIRELLDIAGTGGQLGGLVEDRAAKDFASLARDERITGVALLQ
jgi:hypothetical protein